MQHRIVLAGECDLLPEDIDHELLELTATAAVARLCAREITAGESLEAAAADWRMIQAASYHHGHGAEQYAAALLAQVERTACLSAFAEVNVTKARLC